VLDIGAAPGGWMQAAREIVGEKGYILGVDILPIRQFNETNVETLLGDVSDSCTVDRIKEKMPHGAAAVLCDVSPNVTGVWEVDTARQIDLARSSLEVAKKILQPDGAFFTKVFQGDLFDEFLKEMKQNFRQLHIVKPEASKKKSSEIYILALKLRD